MKDTNQKHYEAYEKEEKEEREENGVDRYLNGKASKLGFW